LLKLTLHEVVIVNMHYATDRSTSLEVGT